MLAKEVFELHNSHDGTDDADYRAIMREIIRVAEQQKWLLWRGTIKSSVKTRLLQDGYCICTEERIIKSLSGSDSDFYHWISWRHYEPARDIASDARGDYC